MPPFTVQDIVNVSRASQSTCDLVVGKSLTADQIVGLILNSHGKVTVKADGLSAQDLAKIAEQGHGRGVTFDFT